MEKRPKNFQRSKLFDLKYGNFYNLQSNYFKFHKGVFNVIVLSLSTFQLSIP